MTTEQFSQACGALPLVSLDFCLLRPGVAGPELLLGLRNNRPAQGWWFTPGGRIRKNEPLTSASTRIVREELGMTTNVLSNARLMGAWDHFYPDSAFEQAVSTHYINLPHWLELSATDAAGLILPKGPDKQHAGWRWLPLDWVSRDELVHPYVRIYAQWLLNNTHLVLSKK